MPSKTAGLDLGASSTEVEQQRGLWDVIHAIAADAIPLFFHHLIWEDVVKLRHLSRDWSASPHVKFVLANKTEGYRSMKHTCEYKECGYNEDPTGIPWYPSPPDWIPNTEDGSCTLRYCVAHSKFTGKELAICRGHTDTTWQIEGDKREVPVCFQCARKQSMLQKVVQGMRHVPDKKSKAFMPWLRRLGGSSQRWQRIRYRRREKEIREKKNASVIEDMALIKIMPWD